MYMRVFFFDFENAFRNSGYGDNFSRRGLRILFDYLESLDDCMDNGGLGVQLDVPAIVQDYVEMDWEELVYQYGDMLHDAGIEDIKTSDYPDDNMIDAVVDAIQDRYGWCDYVENGRFIFEQF